MPLWHRADRWGTTVPKPSVPRSEQLPSRQWSRCAARRRAQRVGAPFAPAESAGRSVDGVQVLEGPQRPPGWTPGHQQRVRRGTWYGPVGRRARSSSRLVMRMR
jgi:hypothetical protein